MRVMNAILMMGLAVCSAEAMPRLGGGGVAVRPAAQMQHHELAVGATASLGVARQPDYRLRVAGGRVLSSSGGVAWLCLGLR